MRPGRLQPRGNLFTSAGPTARLPFVSGTGGLSHSLPTDGGPSLLPHARKTATRLVLYPIGRGRAESNTRSDDLSWKRTGDAARRTRFVFTEQAEHGTRVLCRLGVRGRRRRASGHPAGGIDPCRSGSPDGKSSGLRSLTGASICSHLARRRAQPFRLSPPDEMVRRLEPKTVGRCTYDDAAIFRSRVYQAPRVHRGKSSARSIMPTDPAGSSTPRVSITTPNEQSPLRV